MDWGESDIPDQGGRVAVVTGANSGIGFETARALAAKGARVILACRSAEKGLDAERRMRAAVPGAAVRFLPLDLGSLESIKRFSREVAAAESKIDILCNNAGVMVPPLGRTDEGFELQFGTNHLGHFALTGRLLDLLRRGEGARIVSVASLAHLWGRINFNDLNSERGYNATLAYGQSKLANLLFIRELARRFRARGIPIVAAASHPGVTRTNLQRHSRLLAGSVAMFSQEPSQGCLPSLYAATATGVQGGDYFGPGRMMEMVGAPRPARSTPAAKNLEKAGQLWDVSEHFTQVSYGI
jgi:NAD(P)-dependent dehydrogenase (short-subunit alcohol dehydrogenase family)